MTGPLTDADGQKVKNILFTCKTTAQTRGLGRQLGMMLRPGDTVALVGGLGAGKTTFTQGIGAGAQLPRGHASVRSPSFVFVHEHRGRIPLVHIDLYRLETPAEVAGLGCEDYLLGDWAAVIEWADRAPGLLPAEHLRVEIEPVNDCRPGRAGPPTADRRARCIRFIPHGRRYRRISSQLSSGRTGGTPQ